VGPTHPASFAPQKVPTLEDWQMLPSTSLLGRWEETSTTSTSSQRADWGSWWGMLPANFLCCEVQLRAAELPKIRLPQR
jgi:hypothetical protein